MTRGEGFAVEFVEGRDDPGPASGPSQLVTGVTSHRADRRSATGPRRPMSGCGRGALIAVGVLGFLLLSCAGIAYIVYLSDMDMYEETALGSLDFVRSLSTGDADGLERTLPPYVVEEVDPEVWEAWQDVTRSGRFKGETTEWSEDQLLVRVRYEGRDVRLRILPWGGGFWDDGGPTASIGIVGGGTWPSQVWLSEDDEGRVYVWSVDYADVEYDLESGDLEDFLAAVARGKGADLGPDPSMDATATR